LEGLTRFRISRLTPSLCEDFPFCLAREKEERRVPFTFFRFHLREEKEALLSLRPFLSSDQTPLFDWLKFTSGKKEFPFGRGDFLPFSPCDRRLGQLPFPSLALWMATINPRWRQRGGFLHAGKEVRRKKSAIFSLGVNASRSLHQRIVFLLLKYRKERRNLVCIGICCLKCSWVESLTLFFFSVSSPYPPRSLSLPLSPFRVMGTVVKSAFDLMCLQVRGRMVESSSPSACLSRQSGELSQDLPSYNILNLSQSMQLW